MVVRNYLLNTQKYYEISKNIDASLSVGIQLVNAEAITDCSGSYNEEGNYYSSGTINCYCIKDSLILGVIIDETDCEEIVKNEVVIFKGNQKVNLIAGAKVSIFGTCSANEAGKLIETDANNTKFCLGVKGNGNTTINIGIIAVDKKYISGNVNNNIFDIAVENVIENVTDNTITLDRSVSGTTSVKNFLVKKHNNRLVILQSVIYSCKMKHRINNQ
ncbi:hypothetical protein BCR36DRAFT_373588 [Piromyces finnis]|uniref:Uncharacterized protein n=1 Tax=Piromyces finnis TaxID=1754191 RepID=A0A1Y1V0E5_9FUNG|nr:hypothetical protein BCR36DRAFT_373588 [Piromyces finnis]|eukprot:ORX43937.1 hypothetical protein BCR36DRAFT_373588 [Piromyces finnis]